MIDTEAVWYILKAVQCLWIIMKAYVNEWILGHWVKENAIWDSGKLGGFYTVDYVIFILVN